MKEIEVCWKCSLDGNSRNVYSIFLNNAAGKGYLQDREVDGSVILTLILWKQVVRNSYLPDVVFVLST